MTERDGQAAGIIRLRQGGVKIHRQNAKMSKDPRLKSEQFCFSKIAKTEVFHLFYLFSSKARFQKKKGPDERF